MSILDKINPFKVISKEDKEKDKIKKMYHKKIEQKAFDITKLVIMRKLTLKHIEQLEKMYQTYFEKYPNPKSEQNSIKRIAQLKTMVK